MLQELRKDIFKHSPPIIHRGACQRSGINRSPLHPGASIALLILVAHGQRYSPSASRLSQERRRSDPRITLPTDRLRHRMVIHAGRGQRKRCQLASRVSGITAVAPAVRSSCASLSSIERTSIGSFGWAARALSSVCMAAAGWSIVMNSGLAEKEMSSNENIRQVATTKLDDFLFQWKRSVRASRTASRGA